MGATGKKHVALIKHEDGQFLVSQWRGWPLLGSIEEAQQFRNAAAAKGVRTRLRDGDKFSIVFATVTVEEVTE